MITKDLYQPGVFLICLYASLSASALAAEPQNNPQLRESYQGLMESLAPEPAVNTGSDGILTQLAEGTPQLVANGRGVYLRQCAACHGVELEGQPNWEQPGANGMLPAPPHDGSGHTWHHADDQLFEIVKYGATVAMGDPDYRSLMPAFNDVLSDEDINAVLVYIRSTWSDEHKQWQHGANDAQTGHEWWRENDNKK